MAKLSIDKIIEYLNPAKKCIVPIFVKRQYSINYELLGTATYLESDNSQYLVTARHVFNEYKDQELLIPITDNKIGIIPTNIYSGITEQDIVDIAFCRLEEKLMLFSPIHVNQCNSLQYSKSILSIFGYPSTKTRSRSKIVESGLFCYLTSIENDEKRWLGKIDKRVNYLCKFDQEDSYDIDNKRATFPKPNGISGGGLFEIILDKDGNPISFALIGIVTEWDSVRKKDIKATKIGIILSAIKQKYFDESIKNEIIYDYKYEE